MQSLLLHREIEGEHSMMLVCISNAVHHGRYSASALLCLKLQAEITYATTAQHAMQHWPSSVLCCTVQMKGNTA